jgi:hypothetical protein
MTKMRCPTCGGNGQTLCHVDGIRDGKPFGETRFMKCSTCDGAKEITLEHHERIIVGERRRNERKSRLVSLREEAANLGITAKELSDIENGRITPPSERTA